jgi:hypothetical protein
MSVSKSELIVALNLALKASEETTAKIRAALSALGEGEFVAEPLGSHREDFHPVTGPQASTAVELLTPKQFGMIRALAREAEVDADDECQRFLNCKVDSLSKRAASSFIDHLKELSEGRGVRRAS